MLNEVLPVLDRARLWDFSVSHWSMRRVLCKYIMLFKLKHLNFHHLTFAQADTHADGGQHQAQRGDEDQKHAAEADAFDDMVKVAAAPGVVAVMSSTRVVFGQCRRRISEMKSG